MDVLADLESEIDLEPELRSLRPVEEEAAEEEEAAAAAAVLPSPDGAQALAVRFAERVAQLEASLAQAHPNPNPNPSPSPNPSPNPNPNPNPKP